MKARIDALRSDSEDEYRRLLYVAVTRARDRLYICGTEKQVGDRDKPKRWHNVITAALGGGVRRDRRRATAASRWNGGPRPASCPRPRASRRRWPSPRSARRGWRSPPRRAPPPCAASRRRPRWPATARRRRPRAARCSPATRRGSPPSAAGWCIASSSRCPTSPRTSGASVGRLYPRGAGARNGPRRTAIALVDSALAVLDHPDFAPVFAPGSRAEVEIAGRIGGATLSGRIDRLAVADDRVLIVDYKTNRPAPELGRRRPARLRDAARALPRRAPPALSLKGRSLRQSCGPTGRRSWKFLPCCSTLPKCRPPQAPPELQASPAPRDGLPP